MSMEENSVFNLSCLRLSIIKHPGEKKTCHALVSFVEHMNYPQGHYTSVSPFMRGKSIIHSVHTESIFDNPSN